MDLLTLRLVGAVAARINVRGSFLTVDAQRALSMTRI